MEKLGKKGLALLLCAGLGASMLTGCGKKAEAAAMFTYNGEAVDNNVATFLFRLQEASFDTSYGNMFAPTGKPSRMSSRRRWRSFWWRRITRRITRSR